MGIFKSWSKTYTQLNETLRLVEEAQQTTRRSNQMCQEAINGWQKALEDEVRALDGWEQAGAQRDEVIGMLKKLLADRQAA